MTPYQIHFDVIDMIDQHPLGARVQAHLGRDPGEALMAFYEANKGRRHFFEAIQINAVGHVENEQRIWDFLRWGYAWTGRVVCRFGGPGAQPFEEASFRNGFRVYPVTA